MTGKQGLSLKDLDFLKRVYKSCKNDEQRKTYFEWEARLFKQVVQTSAYNALKIDRFRVDRLR